MKFIKEHFSYSEFQIWRLLINNKNEILIEERNVEKKETTFSVFSLEKGKLIIKKLSLEEKYWTGIEVFSDDYIIFHKFAQPNMPLHKGIIYYDLNLKKIIWQNENFTFLKIENDFIYGYKQQFEGKVFSVFNLQTGEVIENDSLINNIKLNNDKDEIRNDLIFPTLGDLPLEFQNKIINLDSINYEWILYGNLLFLSFLRKEDELNGEIILNCLEINSGTIIFDIVLNKKCNYFIPDSFFIVSDYLITIANKNKLLVYKLNVKF